MIKNAIIKFRFYSTNIHSRQKKIGAIHENSANARSQRKKNGKSNFSAGASRWVGQWTTCATTCKETQGGRLATLLRSRASTCIQSARVYKW